MNATIAIRIAAVLLLAPLLAAGSCSSAPTRPQLPAATVPAHTVTTRDVYVQIPPSLTDHAQAIPAGPLADAPLVAKQRGEALKVCWANLDEIAAIEGTPVPPKGKAKP
jgi:hypothetical protein